MGPISSRRKEIKVSNSTILYRGLDLKPILPGHRPIRFDPNRLDPANGFYGRGVYFVSTREEATIWGNHIAQYASTRALKLWIEPKSQRGVNIGRTDYLKKLPIGYDGIVFGPGAEGGRQILLNDPTLVRLVRKKV